MGLPAKLLGTDEVEVLHLRTHGKALILPAVLLMVLAGLFGTGMAIMPAELRPWGYWVVAAVCFVAAIVLCLVPLLRWWTTTYTLTTRRIITRRGIIARHGHDLPLLRINDVSYQRSFSDRLFGCGTLVLQTAAEDPVILPDIPSVERVHVRMTELLFGTPVVEAAEDH